MSSRLYGIRGATGAENTKESVTQNVCQMCLELVKENNLKPEDIVSIQFTITSDLNLMNPAAALRRGQNQVDFSGVPLFCSQEPEIAGSPEKMVRVLFTAYMEEGSKVVPVYINGGEKLRPD
ncbi:MAG: chorismate mutase, partial [Treponema sp.]|nr:chorismate mutase [Candidatus Treponema equifaecale]